MSEIDQNTNAITEEERKQQLAKLNVNVDESITAVESNADIPKKNVDGGIFNQKETVFNGNSQSNDFTANDNGHDVHDVAYELNSKDIPKEVLEEVVDDISNGIVEDFSKNIATYVTEVAKFDEKYDKDEKKETQDKESAESGSETTENSSENMNGQNVEQTNTNKDNSDEQTKKEPLNPDNVKENDVKDECLSDKKEETDKKTEDDKDGADEYMDLLGNGLLKRKVIDGKDVEDIKPYHGDIVTINCSGKLEDGSVVDEFTELTFAVGEGDVVQAWDLGVMTTKVGQTIELITAPKYAYGELGRTPDIPANATITYTIKLLKKEEAPDIDKLDIDQRMSMAEQKRERGNFLFSRVDYPGAINSYNKAIKILESGSLQGSPEKLQGLADCRLKCCNNMAACQLKVEAYDAAIKSCLSVLDLQPENVKALFRLGKAYTAKGSTKEGVLYLQKALKLEPDSKVIKQEIRKLKDKITKETELEKDMYKKMMGTKKPAAVAKSEPQQKSWKWAFAGGAVAALVAAGLAAYRYGHH